MKKQLYEKVARWICWILMVLSVIILIWGMGTGFESNNGKAVDVLLNWGYILLAVAVALVIILGIYNAATINPKSLIKLVIGLVAAVVVVGVVYATASGAELVGYIGTMPSHSTLKLTDTLLNLTYLLGGVAIVTIIFGEIYSSVKK